MGRFSPPLHLPGATEFSAERDVLCPLWFVRTLKQTAWLWRELEKATRLDRNWGRRKQPGHWALAYLAFAVSGHADIEPWWKQTSSELWHECGFEARPSYQTTYERLIELETVSGEFAKTAGKLIQHCRRHEPLIGAHVHVDGTEAETHAALVHDCRPGEPCMWRGRAPRKRPERVTTDVARAQRHKETERPAEDHPNIGEADEVRVEDERLRVRVGKHWYRTLDPTAGVRAYMGPRGARRFWHGYYNIKAVDHYTGAPVAVGVYSASVNEHLSYPDLLSRSISAIGSEPETIVADRGFSIRTVFEMNTRQGIASVIPWRQANGSEQRHDNETHDRHGIPRCKHCGAPGEFVRFADKPSPRLWFRCARETTPECAKTQTISCSKEWRLLIPLWRTDPVYHELEESHQRYERVHHHWRERYLVAGDHLSSRPKRRGIAWQELRSQAAMVAEWLALAWREGWLGSARRNKHEPTRNEYVGHQRAQSLLSFRRRVGLACCYGKTAKALGLGFADPPSRRAQGPPADDDPPAVF